MLQEFGGVNNSNDDVRSSKHVSKIVIQSWEAIRVIIARRHEKCVALDAHLRGIAIR